MDCQTLSEVIFHLKLGNKVVQIKSNLWEVIEKIIFIGTVVCIAILVFFHISENHHLRITLCLQKTLARTGEYSPISQIIVHSFAQENHTLEKINPDGTNEIIRLERDAELELCNNSFNSVFFPITISPLSLREIEVLTKQTSWLGQCWEETSRLFWFILLQLGYKMLAIVLYDSIVKFIFWKVTSYTWVRAISVVVSLMFMIAFSAGPGIYGSTLLAIVEGLGSFLIKVLSEMIFINFSKSLDFQLFDFASALIFHVYTLRYPTYFSCILISLILRLCLALYQLYKHTSKRAWNVLTDAQEVLQSRRLSLNHQFGNYSSIN